MASAAMNQPLLQNQSTALDKGESGGVLLPRWASAGEVVAWVRLLSRRDACKAGQVTMYHGFRETAYRCVFPYKEQYKDKQAQLQNLITILPSAQRENDEPLLHNKEAGLIAYPYCQSMDAELAKLQHGVDPFVWAREDGTYAVVQTWPVEINTAFAESFKEEKLPDAEKFKPEALTEFKTSMRKLFKLEKTADLTVMCVSRVKDNDGLLYRGTGAALMAMLRVSKDIREELMIKSLVGRNCLDCMWKCEDRTGSKQWKLDLNMEYYLYLKKGWDTMACVKPKDQFDWDSKPIGEGKMYVASSTNETLPYVMDLDWFASEAYPWTLWGAGLVWTSAALVVLLRWWGPALGWHWVDELGVLAVATGVSSAFALYADFSAMKWCIVPWLQNVRKLEIMQCKLPFRLFLLVQLSSTFLQVLTIQSNAWFMVSASKTSDALLDTWVYLWTHSSFRFLPESTWRNWITPKSMAIFFWWLSTVQLTLPIMTSVRLSGTKGLPFPTRNAKDAEVTESDKFLIKQGQQEEIVFMPESYYNDFSTCWSKLISWVLEVWGVSNFTCTYRESVANLALASGFRYTGSLSLSYPIQRIKEIIEFQGGYNVNTKNGLEPLPMGWELRALQEFQKLAWCHRNRVFFIMVCKLALQMNLQITFFIMLRLQRGRLSVEVASRANMMAMVSILSLLLTFCTEFLDVILITRIFFSVWKKVRGTALKVGGSSKVFALDEFVVYEDGASIQSIVHSGKDLKAEYYIAVRHYCRMILFSLFSTWLVGYALLKAFCAVRCNHGSWEFAAGCLPPFNHTGNETAGQCFGSIF